MNGKDAPNPAWSGSASKRASHSRSGCATCRRRRVRCDERREVCANCARLGLSCSWYRPTELSQRSRVNTACDRCRTKKIRCTSTCPTGPCGPCQSADVVCVNTNQNSANIIASNDVSGSTVAAASPVSSQLPDRSEQRRLLLAYFDGPHYHCFYTFIHQPTFEQMFDCNEIPVYLILIVIATSLHFLEPENHLADQWADECRRLIMLEIFSPPSTTMLQALLLLQRYEWHRASHISAWFISGLAVRLAHGLQLNIEIVDKARVPAVLQETRRRLAWSCFIMESMIEGGRKPLSWLDYSSMEVRLPCSEGSFRHGFETNMPDIEHLYDNNVNPQQETGSGLPPVVTSENELGISAFLVKLTALRRAILNWTLPYHPRNKGHMPLVSPWAADSPFYRFEAELQGWRSHLPEDLIFKPELIYRKDTQLVNFVTLHCLFHGCYCDLYRIGSYVTAFRGSDTTDADPTQSFLTACRRGRLQNALAICNVIFQSMEYHSSGYDPVVGISAALAMRVLIIERKHEDSEAIGLSDEALYAILDRTVQCAKSIARRSVPIRDLFCSVCVLAKQRGLYIDLTGITIGPDSTVAGDHPKKSERESSPSLRTYGTFGRIQNSLEMRDDVHAPAASTSTDKESDIFNNIDRPPQSSSEGPRSLQIQNDLIGIYNPPAEGSYVSTESFSPNDHAIAPGWGDGTLNFSMMPLQFDWINQSLRYDFNSESS